MILQLPSVIMRRHFAPSLMAFSFIYGPWLSLCVGFISVINCWFHWHYIEHKNTNVFCVSVLCRLGYHSRYSDSLRTWRSGYRIPVGGQIFRTLPAQPWGPPSPCTVHTGSFPRLKRPKRVVDHPPHLIPRLRKEYSYTCAPILGLRGLFKGDLYL
jgi:hypothetical protein